MARVINGDVMTKKMPVRFASWEEAEAAFDRFYSLLPERREQLRTRLRATGGPDLDGSLETLTPVMRWYIDTALEDADDGMDWWSEWLAPNNPHFKPDEDNPRQPSPQLVRLWEMVGIYVADVVQPLVPHARWVCWRAKAATELTAGAFALDFGDQLFPFDVFPAANAGLVNWYIYYGTGHRRERPINPDEFEPALRERVLRRETLRRGRPLTWQKAPTGPDAFRRTSTPDW